MSSWLRYIELHDRDDAVQLVPLGNITRIGERRHISPGDPCLSFLRFSDGTELTVRETLGQIRDLLLGAGL